MEFGYTGQVPRFEHEIRTCAFNDLYSFIANYVDKSYCMSFISKWLKDNRGKCLLYLSIVCDLVYAITIIKNHEPVWERDHFKETFKDDELNEYDNYKELEDPEEIEKYSPKIPRLVRGLE